MAARLKRHVFAHEAGHPYNGFDSELELPGHRSNLLKQNGWLTLKMRLHANFVDGTNQTSYDFDHESHTAKARRGDQALLRKIGGRFYARDHDDWLFPIRNWTAAEKRSFGRRLVAHAQGVWNYQFVLRTPRRYQGLDIDFNMNGDRVRPNLICLFRLHLVPLTAQPHLVVNIVKLDPSATTVSQLGSGDTKALPAVRNSYTSRSNAANYDDQDLLNPGPAPVRTRGGRTPVKSDTIGHEIGHALGQPHIMKLVGKPCTNDPSDVTLAAAKCYGVSDMEKANIMGHGDRVYLVNAISWQKRVVHHCPGTSVSQWQATGIMKTPPQRVR